MLELHNLTVSYKSKNKELDVLKNINTSFPVGKITAVIGPSGCGKSTLLYALAGIIKGYNGRITYNEQDIRTQRLKIGYIPQNYGLLPWKSVKENICLPFKLSRNKKSGIYDEIIEGLGISNLMQRYPNQLSGGQKQRAAIARAFVMEPDILLMDEPFSALDALTREETQDLFLKIWEKQKSTTIFITHSVEEAAYLGDRIAIMSNFLGRINEVIENPMFGVKEARVNRLYYEFQLFLRERIKKEWSI